MDSGSPTPLVDDPTGALKDLEKVGGVEFKNLAAAAIQTEEAAEKKSAELGKHQVADDLSIVAFGSWARGELTDGSDHDWAVLVAREFEDDDVAVSHALEVAGSCLGEEDKKPGSQAVFGVPFAVNGLVDNIGLDEDSNRNLTRRMLLLLESRELHGGSHDECWRRVLNRYLAFGIKNNRPPRFFLNDLVRYWRTICVDFEGKHKDKGGEDKKWVTRNAKLRTSRKLLFAGGLLPILLCHLREADEMDAFLTAWLRARPTDRLAAAFLHYDAIGEGVRTLGAYDRWLALMRDGDARAELKTLTADTRDDSLVWQEVRGIGEELQRGLTALLFDTALRPLAPQYAIF